MINVIKSLNVVLVPLTESEKEELEEHPINPEEIYEIFRILGTDNYYMMSLEAKRVNKESIPVAFSEVATEKAYFYNGTSHISYDAVDISDRPVYMVAPTDDSLVGGYQILNGYSVPLSEIIDHSFVIKPNGSFVYARQRK